MPIPLADFRTTFSSADPAMHDQRLVCQDRWLRCHTLNGKQAGADTDKLATMLGRVLDIWHTLAALHPADDWYVVDANYENLTPADLAIPSAAQLTAEYCANGWEDFFIDLAKPWTVIEPTAENDLAIPVALWAAPLPAGEQPVTQYFTHQIQINRPHSMLVSMHRKTLVYVYDGGIDVVTETPAECARLKQAYRTWDAPYYPGITAETAQSPVDGVYSWFKVSASGRHLTTEELQRWQQERHSDANPGSANPLVEQTTWTQSWLNTADEHELPNVELEYLTEPGTTELSGRIDLAEETAQDHIDQVEQWLTDVTKLAAHDGCPAEQVRFRQDETEHSLAEFVAHLRNQVAEVTAEHE